MLKSLDRASLLSLLSLLCACATPLSGPATTQDKLGKAITSPLTDFNLMQTEIPAVVQDALKNPYQIPADHSCAALTDQVNLLNAALGPDLDAVVSSSASSLTDKGSALVQDEAVGSVERTINGVIPFRSWVRKLSGAEKHSREVATAIAAGVVRRAFLKGMGQERGCAAPAAPLQVPPG